MYIFFTVSKLFFLLRFVIKLVIMLRRVRRRAKLYTLRRTRLIKNLHLACYLPLRAVKKKQKTHKNAYQRHWLPVEIV